MPSWTDRIERGLSLAGERLQINALVYNPLVMRKYDLYGARDAPGFTRRIYSVLGSKRYLDVGAGTGRYAGQLRALGAHADACEHSRGGRRIAAKRGIAVARFDLSQDPPVILNESYDVALCLEVAEHLPALLAPRLVDFLSSFPLVVFTAAPPGQGGTGHINEQPRSYWEDLFRRRGHERAHHLEGNVLTSPGEVPGQYLLDNLMIFAISSQE